MFISDSQILQQLLANKIPHTGSKSQGDPARKKKKKEKKKRQGKKIYLSTGANVLGALLIGSA